MDTRDGQRSWLWGESPVRFSEIYDGEGTTLALSRLNGTAEGPFRGQKTSSSHRKENLSANRSVLAANRIFLDTCWRNQSGFWAGGHRICGVFTVGGWKKVRRYVSSTERCGRDGNFYNAITAARQGAEFAISAVKGEADLASPRLPFGFAT